MGDLAAGGGGPGAALQIELPHEDGPDAQLGGQDGCDIRDRFVEAWTTKELLPDSEDVHARQDSGLGVEIASTRRLVLVRGKATVHAE
jgi:hypothetical protein